MSLQDYKISRIVYTKIQSVKTHVVYANIRTKCEQFFFGYVITIKTHDGLEIQCPKNLNKKGCHYGNYLLSSSV